MKNSPQEQGAQQNTTQTSSNSLQMPPELYNGNSSRNIDSNYEHFNMIGMQDDDIDFTNNFEMNLMDNTNHVPGNSRRSEVYRDYDDDMNNLEGNQNMTMNNVPHKQPFNMRNVSNELNIGQNGGKPRFNQFKGQSNNKFMNGGNNNFNSFGNRGQNQQNRHKMVPRIPRQNQGNMNFTPF